METLFCQSCGMPMNEAGVHGTNADGSVNTDYCSYCYKNGTFTADVNMEQMIATCAEYYEHWEPKVTKEEAIAQMKLYFPKLKRWAK